MVSTALALVLQVGVKSKGIESFFLLFDFFLQILAIKDVPLPAPRRDGPREGLDFLAHYFIEAIFAVEKLCQDAFGFCQRPGLVGKICQILFPQTIYDEMRQMRDPVIREVAHGSISLTVTVRLV